MPVQVDFRSVFRKEATFDELTAGLTADDFREFVNDAIDRMIEALDEVTDRDLTFVASEESAEDGIGWTIGHVIVHQTATLEEASALAAELARGVIRDGRSRYEMPWESITSVDQLYQRLMESRRMLLGALDMWPDEPHLETTVYLEWLGASVNCKGRLALGLAHDALHYEHIAQIRQQIAARSVGV